MRSKRALIVTGVIESGSGVVPFLRQCGFADVCTAVSGDEARRCAVHDNFDLILINMPLTDEQGDRLAVHMSSHTSAGIILLCRADAADEVNCRTSEHGVSVISKPIHKTAFHQAISSGMSVRNRLVFMKQENVRLQNKLREMRVVSRAKCMLIEKKSMTENEAHKYIEKLAMDTRSTREKIAEELIDIL
ncbi:MAG: ANTAR domain-containing protein [Ruminococcus sp.]|nr:ANTAR domain-containing protein [Ruminococcus sp.]